MKVLHFNILTLFPAFFDEFLRTSLVGRAVTNKIVTCQTIDIRKFGVGNHRKVDDYAFGGEAGMLLRHDVLARAHDSLTIKPTYTLYLSPRGRPLNQELVHKFCRVTEKSSLTLVCGHYEGIDQRFIDTRVDEEISIGDYVLSGGESAALVLMDAMIRLKEHVVGNPASLINESFEKILLEHHQYTRPYDEHVPQILASGHHQAVADWKQANRLAVTYEKRPDLFKQYPISSHEHSLLKHHIYQKFSYNPQK